MTPRLWAVDWLENSQPIAQANTNFVTVQQQMVTNQFEGYAQVEPVALLPVRVAQSGVITGLEIMPGTTVRSGQTLAELSGPEIQALLAQDEANAYSAKSNLLASQESLAIQQEQLASHLVTHLMILQAESAVAQAQSAYDTAQAQLQAVRQTITLKSPTDGIVLSVNATDGERIGIGDTVLTLQSPDKLWLKADYYGINANAIQISMIGQFLPADGGEPIPVKVSTVFGGLTPDGAEAVGLVATTTSPDWLNGQSGTVTLNGAQRLLVVVPTRALVLDQGKWWVLVRTEKGEEPQAVVPGPACGWQTAIQSGLRAGEQIVVENAYLEFHRGISENYQPPD